MLLVDLLVGKSWVPVQHVTEVAARKGISGRLMREVAKEFAIQVQKVDFDGAWQWAWNETPRPERPY